MTRTNITIESLIKTELAAAIVAATGDARLLPIVYSVAGDVAIKFGKHTTTTINTDLQVNLTNYADIPSGIYSNLNTRINNISSVDLVGLVDQYSTSGLDARLMSTLSSMLYSSIVQKAGITLPAKFDQRLITNLVAPLAAATINNVIGSVVNSFVNSAYDNYSLPASDDTILSRLDSDDSTDPIEYVSGTTETIQTNIVQENLNELKRFQTFSDENSKKMQTTKQGFVDPNAFYPDVAYQGIAETNKLAQGIVEGTVVQSKFDNRMLGAKLPDSESFSEPVSSYKARYPFNQVQETPSGHIIEIDDTPGSERIHVYHKTGTYYEMDAEGNVLHRSRGSEYRIVDRNDYLSVTGNGNISIGGELKVMVSGNAHIEVTGNTVVNCMNDAEINASGRLALTAGEAIDMRSPKIYIQADEELHITADVFSRQEYQKLDVIVHENMVTTVEGDIDLTGKKKMIVQTTDDIEVTGGKNIHISTVADFQVKSAANIVYEAATTVSNKASTITNNSSGNINLTASGIINANAVGIVAIDGSQVYIASGASSVVAGLTSTNPSLPIAANEADYSQAGLLDGREDFVNIAISDVLPNTFMDEPAFTSDDVTDAATNKSVQDSMIKEGLAKPEDFKEVPVDEKSDTSTKTSSIGYIEPDKKLLALDVVPPDNFMLSPHFNLGMVSAIAPAQPHKVKAQNGKSVGELIYNLSAVALNVLEPIYAVYPNMFVTSGFRNVEASKTAKSAHPYGLAVDMQFKGVAKSEYYNIAKNIKNLLNSYDQLLLEYKSTGSGNPWIHIGLKNINGEQRNQVSTFYNNAPHSSGLTQLA